MNNTEVESKTVYVSIFNAIVSIVIMLINIHQSYSSRSCESECFGKPMLKMESKKEKFDV